MDAYNRYMGKFRKGKSGGNKDLQMMMTGLYRELKQLSPGSVVTRYIELIRANPVPNRTDPGFEELFWRRMMHFSVLMEYAGGDGQRVLTAMFDRVSIYELPGIADGLLPDALASYDIYADAGNVETLLAMTVTLTTALDRKLKAMAGRASQE